ncbi:uncharacterized protein LOC144003010 [Festucalex cinctus]
MYIKSMDMTSSKHMDAVQITLKPATKLRWTQLRVAHEEDETFGQCRLSATGVKSPSTRKRHGRNRRRKLTSGPYNAEPREERRSAACARRLAPGAMAPENTTQYLIQEHEYNMASSSKNRENESPSSLEGL